MLNSASNPKIKTTAFFLGNEFLSSLKTDMSIGPCSSLESKIEIIGTCSFLFGGFVDLHFQDTCVSVNDGCVAFNPEL